MIINAGVTVKKLTVKGGNLKIYGKVEQLVHDAGDTTIYIIKGTEASLPATIDSKFVVQSDVAVLKTAFANGEDFKLSADADITGQSVSVPAGKSVVLDLNGYTLTADNSATGKIIVLGKMTLKDSSTEKKGKIVASQDYTAASYNGSLIEIAGEDATMTMESGNISAVRETPDSNGQYGVGVTDGGDFTMTGGKIEAGWFAVAGNGNYKTQNSIINITDGELISTADYAVYLPQSGTTTISGGKVYGAAGGVCIQRGTLNVEGTALITSKGTGSTGNWGDGTGGLDCAAINVSGAYGIATVNIKGGTLIAEAKSLITEGTTYTPVINVTGGTFSDPSVLKYMATNATVDIKLLSNINIAKTELATGYILNAANATANLNLNGHDIINSSETADATPFTQIFTVQNGTLNISGNGNVKCDASATAKDDGYRMVIEARGYGTVNIHGGSYYNTQKLNTQIDLIYVRENGKINIYGGTFESGKYGTPNNDTDGRYWVLNLKNTDKNTASIQVSGGTFINFNPANPNMDDNESYLVTGYEVTRDGSVYTAAHKVGDGRKEYIVGQTSQENR